MLGIVHAVIYDNFIYENICYYTIYKKFHTIIIKVQYNISLKE